MRQPPSVCLRCCTETTRSRFEFSAYRKTKLEDSYFDKDLERAFMTASRDVFETKTKPTLLLANQVGNMYTPSLYGGLLSFIFNGYVCAVALPRC